MDRCAKINGLICEDKWTQTEINGPIRENTWTNLIVWEGRDLAAEGRDVEECHLVRPLVRIPLRKLHLPDSVQRVSRRVCTECVENVGECVGECVDGIQKSV